VGELDKVVKALNKKFGDGYIGLGTQLLDRTLQRRSMGIFALDLGLGGGIAHRKIMMLAGKESSGKTTSMLLTIAETQRQGGKCALIDIEHNFDPVYAEVLGVKVDELLVAQSKTIEETSDTIEPLIMSGELDLITLDSIAAAPSDKELEESAEQKSMGGKAKSIDLMMKKIVARLNDVSNPVTTSILLLNQIRDNIGGYGSPEYSPGGHQLHHSSDIIVWLRPDSEPVGGKEEPKGINIKFKVTKNRTYPPFKTGSYHLIFGKGVDNTRSIVEKAVEWGLIKKAGPWFSYKETKTSGLDNFMSAVSKEILEEIKVEVFKLKDSPPKVEKEKDEDTDLELICK
jgi:recombination protein RecA